MNKNRQSGFTLVELIVVIAILGILAGVGTVAYTGYVEKANKAVDQQLVADIEYAMQLAYASDPQGFTGAASVVLDTTGSAVRGAEGSAAVGWVTEAMERAFGNDWATTLKLKYTKWGKGSAVSKDVLEYFTGDAQSIDGVKDVVNGNAVPSFADDVDDLFYLIKDTAMWVKGEDGSGAALVQGAAGLTTNATAAQFAEAWAGSAWDGSLFMNGASYSDEAVDANRADSNFMDNAIANAGAIKARNISLGTYLRNTQYGDGEAIYNFCANYNYGSSAVPKDLAAIFINGTEAEKNELKQQLSNAGLTSFTVTVGDATDTIDYWDYIGNYLNQYYGRDENTGNLPVGDALKNSQAYKDGLAYYTMMNTVGKVNNTNQDDDTYWDEMQSAVSLYGSIARGEATPNDLSAAFENVGENQVLVIVSAAGNTFAVRVAPMTAQAGN